VKIVVCMKETPSTTAEKRFGQDMRLERRKEDAIINPFDEYTIEEGLRQQEKHGGEVVVLCMGPAIASDSIARRARWARIAACWSAMTRSLGPTPSGRRVLAAALKIGFDLALSRRRCRLVWWCGPQRRRRTARHAAARSPASWMWTAEREDQRRLLGNEVEAARPRSARRRRLLRYPR
jgi:hypothetical protein